MDIIFESVNIHGHVFRIRLPRQMSMAPSMRLRTSLDRANHRSIRSMNEHGNSFKLDDVA